MGANECVLFLCTDNKATDVNAYRPFAAGVQYTIKAGADNWVTVAQSAHDRVDCCVKNVGWWSGWHSCTEFQPSK